MALDPITLSLIGAGIGLAKNELIDEPQYRDQARIEGMKSAFGPLLGTEGNLPNRPNAFQSALDFGLTGAAAGSMFGSKPGSSASLDVSKTNTSGSLSKNSVKALPSTNTRSTFKAPPPTQSIQSNQSPMLNSREITGLPTADEYLQLPAIPRETQRTSFINPLEVRSLGIYSGNLRD